MEPIIIRAHHLESFLILRNHSRDSLASSLFEEGYITDANDSFIDHILEVRRLLQSPEQTIRIVVGEPDIICNYPCPKRQDCPYVFPEKSKLFGSAFYDSTQTLSAVDWSCASLLGVKHGETYSSRELFG